MKKSKPDRSSQPFRENQIIYLEDANTRLYGEVIQLITTRQMCWLRPICLVISDCPEDPTSEDFRLVPLNSTSDIVWPTCLFHSALDTEVISFLVHLENTDKLKSTNLSSRQYLNQFLHGVWIANRDRF